MFIYTTTQLILLDIGALTYLEKIVNCLDFLDPDNIMELSLSKLNTILDQEDIEMKNSYLEIKNSRYTISKTDFKLYLRFLENNHNTNDAKKMFEYISQLYNGNEILQDNISFTDYLKEMSTIKSKKLFSMRLHEITEKLKIRDINYENFNESKKLLNDLENI